MQTIMRRFARVSGVGLAVVLASACSMMGRPHADADAEPPLPPVAVARHGEAGGVFSPEAPWSLVSDSRAFRVGDVLTVVLQEVTQARKSADTSYGKQSSVAVAPAVVGGNEIDSDISISAQREFSGSATSTQQNALQGSITVMVYEVLPNGLLRVAGEKRLYLNRDEEVIRLSGYVRAEDIDTNNRVSSQRVASARIEYSGRGTSKDVNSPGWLMRFFSGRWMPF